MPPPSLLRALAASLSAGETTRETIVARLTITLGRPWRWLRPVARRYVEAFSAKTRPRQREIVQFLRLDADLNRAWSKYSHEITIEHWLNNPGQMQPVRAATGWELPVIESVQGLAAWLGLTVNELLWFADLKGLGYKQNSEKLHHYHYRRIPWES
jgi:hypothetical protein